MHEKLEKNQSNQYSPSVTQLKGLGRPIFINNRSTSVTQQKLQDVSNRQVIQQKALAKKKLNVVGESHPESKPRRAKEEAYTKAMLGKDAIYKTESQFRTSAWAFQDDRYGDPMLLRAEMLLAMIKDHGISKLEDSKWDGQKNEMISILDEAARALFYALHETAEQKQAMKAETAYEALKKLAKEIPTHDLGYFITEFHKVTKLYAKDVLGKSDIRSEATVNELRSSAMQGAAADNADRWTGEQMGVWKVGNDHISEIKAEKKNNKYELMGKSEFNDDFLPWLAKNP
ncbi:hypothetical protein ACFPK9_00855 [Rubritalea spongiae]|uniref:Uncharacterized protein n=1 Tax=Rubritalea spongiae TaxID=430797 RepID=A0ABW5E7V0_9BACT